MPTFKGIKAKRADHLGWRPVDPSRDLDTCGNLRGEESGVSIVYIKDCEIEIKKDANGIPRTYYVADDVKAIPMSDGASWYGYGKTREYRRIARFKSTDIHQGWLSVDGEPFTLLVRRYWTTPVYFVKDGIVYTGSIKSIVPSISAFREQVPGISMAEIQHRLRQYRSLIRLDDDCSYVYGSPEKLETLKYDLFAPVKTVETAMDLATVLFGTDYNNTQLAVFGRSRAMEHLRTAIQNYAYNRCEQTITVDLDENGVVFSCGYNLRTAVLSFPMTVGRFLGALDDLDDRISADIAWQEEQEAKEQNNE